MLEWDSSERMTVYLKASIYVPNVSGFVRRGDTAARWPFVRFQRNEMRTGAYRIAL